jgi:hypothetical protein
VFEMPAQQKPIPHAEQRGNTTVCLARALVHIIPTRDMAGVATCGIIGIGFSTHGEPPVILGVVVANRSGDRLNIVTARAR